MFAGRFAPRERSCGLSSTCFRSLRALEQADAADGRSHGQARTTPVADPQLRYAAN